MPTTPTLLPYRDRVLESERRFVHLGKSAENRQTIVQWVYPHVLRECFSGSGPKPELCLGPRILLGFGICTTIWQNSVSASHHGINSNSTDAAGKDIGNGQAFNGSNQWVTVPHANALSFTATES